MCYDTFNILMFIYMSDDLLPFSWVWGFIISLLGANLRRSLVALRNLSLSLSPPFRCWTRRALLRIFTINLCVALKRGGEWSLLALLFFTFFLLFLLLFSLFSFTYIYRNIILMNMEVKVKSMEAVTRNYATRTSEFGQHFASTRISPFLMLRRIHNCHGQGNTFHSIMIYDAF